MSKKKPSLPGWRKAVPEMLRPYFCLIKGRRSIFPFLLDELL